MVVQKDMSGRAWAELLLLSAIWGGVFLAVRTALDEIGPFTAVAHRIVWAAPILVTVALAMGHRLPTGLRLWGAFLVMGALNNVIPFSLQAWGQTQIETGLVAIFNALTAVFGVLIAALFMADERLTARKAMGVGLGFAGVVIAMGWRAFLELDLRSLAQLAVIASTLSYALAGVWARRHLGHLAPQMAAAGMLCASSLLILPIAWGVEGPISLSLEPDTWAAIAYYAVAATAGAYLLYYRVLAMAGAGNLMLCTLLMTPIAILLGVIVLGEALPLRALAGFGVLALGLLVIDGRLFRRSNKALATGAAPR